MQIWPDFRPKTRPSSVKSLVLLAEKLSMGLPIKVDEKQLQELSKKKKSQEESKLFELNGETIDLGVSDSLRYLILGNVLEEKYDVALQELKNFRQEPSVYPNFKQKVERLLAHCVDLIYAIKAKRNFPGLSSLTRPKQQELREKYLTHFRELQMTLKRVEKVETDLRLNDVKSTLYVIQALCVATFAILILAFVLEVIHGLAFTSAVVADDAYTKAINFVFELLHL